MPNSHWPTLLQDIGLLPKPYCTDDARQDHRLMRDLWQQRRDHLRTEPIEDYHETIVRVPLAMNNVFQNDAQHYHQETRSVLYEFLVWEMQLFVNHYPARLSKSIRVERRNYMPGKLLRFKAFYWLTVLDRFISTVQLANAVEGVLLSCPFPRTVLDRPDANEVAQQSPSVDLVAAPLAAPVIAQYPIPQQAPGPRAPSPVYPHQIGPPPAYSQLHHPRSQSPPYPLNPGPRVRPMTQQMTYLLAQPGTSGSNPARRPPSPERGTKRKATNQGGGSYKEAAREVLED